MKVSITANLVLLAVLLSTALAPTLPISQELSVPHVSRVLRAECLRMSQSSGGSSSRGNGGGAAAADAAPCACPPSSSAATAAAQASAGAPLDLAIPRKLHQIYLGSMPQEQAALAASCAAHHGRRAGWSYRLWDEAAGRRLIERVDPGFLAVRVERGCGFLEWAGSCG